MVKNIYSCLVLVVLQASSGFLFADRCMPEVIPVLCELHLGGIQEAPDTQLNLGVYLEDTPAMELEPEVTPAMIGSAYRMALQHAERAIECDLYGLLNSHTDPFLRGGYERVARSLGLDFQQIHENANYAAILAAVRAHVAELLNSLPANLTASPVDLTAEELVEALPSVLDAVNELDRENDHPANEERDRRIRGFIFRHMVMYCYQGVSELQDLAPSLLVRARERLVGVLYIFQAGIEDRMALFVNNRALSDAWALLQWELEAMRTRAPVDLPWADYAMVALNMSVFDFAMLRARMDYAAFEQRGRFVVGQIYYQEGIFAHPNFVGVTEEELDMHSGLYANAIDRSIEQFSAVILRIEGSESEVYTARAIFSLVLSRLYNLKGDRSGQNFYFEKSLEDFVLALRNAPFEETNIVTTFASMRNATHVQSEY